MVIITNRILLIMVQDKTIVKFVSLAYLGLSLALVICCYLFLNWRGELVMLIIALVGGFFVMLSGLGYVLKILSAPDFIIKNPRVDPYDVGTKDEFKDVLFKIRNKGKTKAIDCKFEIKVKDSGKEFVQLRKPIDKKTSINSGDEITINLCNVRKISSNVIINTGINQCLLLDRGKKYPLELKITGDNFQVKKISDFELDLSSWKNIGIILDC